MRIVSSWLGRVHGSIWIVLAMIFAATSIVGCRDSRLLPAGVEPALLPDGDTAQGGDTTVRGASPWVATLTSDQQRYTREQVVRFTLILRNSSKKDQTLSFRSGRSFDLSATPIGGSKPVWQWARGEMFTMALRQLVVKAGKSKSWSVEWNQQDNNGKRLPAGAYEVVGKIVAEGEIKAKPVEIKLSGR